MLISAAFSLNSVASHISSQTSPRYSVKLIPAHYLDHVASCYAPIVLAYAPDDEILDIIPTLNGIIKICSGVFSSPWNPIFSRHLDIITIIFHFQAIPTNKGRHVLGWCCGRCGWLGECLRGGGHLMGIHQHPR